MRKYVDFVFAVGGGGAVVGATVTVKDSGDNLATLYSDDGVTPTTNPVVTDENGMFEFYVADGEYTLLVDDGTNDITITDVQIWDDSGQQPLDDNLSSLAAITPTANNLLYFNDIANLSIAPITSFGRSIIDDADAPSVRATIGAAASGANSDITSLSGITGGIATADFIDIDTTAAIAGAVGRLKWNDTDGTLDLGLKGGNVTLQLGQEINQMVRNVTGSTISDGQVVKVTGASGNRMTVELAQANSDLNSATTIGVVTESILNNEPGFITTFGLVRDIDTSSFAEGAALYLSPTTPGALTTTKPVAPQHMVLIGFVVRSHATVGSIFVNVQNGYEIDELHDVKITGTPSAGSLLIRNATDAIWENATLTAGSGISITNGDKSITIASSAAGTVTSVNVSGGTTGLSFSGGPITSSGTITAGGTLAVANGGTGSTTAADARVALGVPATDGTGASGTWSISISGNAANITGTVAVANGGTGATTAAGARTNLLPSFTGNGGKVLAVNAGATDIEYISVGGTGTVTSVDVSGGTTGLTTSGGPITGAGTITLSGTLGVANGGTGATTLTGYVKGSGTSALAASSTIPGSDISGNISGNAANVTGTVAVANGGTGSTTASGALTNLGAVAKAGDTMTGKLTLVTSSTSSAGINFGNGTAPTTPSDGDMWMTGASLQYRIGGTTLTTATLGGTQTLTGDKTFSGTLTASGIVTLTGGTGTGTYSFATGVTSTGNTKTVNIGTAGASGSTTAITIGATAGTSSTTMNGTMVMGSDYTEKVNALGTGSSFSPVLSGGTVITLTTNANATITLPSSVAGKSYVIIVNYGGAHTLTWAGGSTIKWNGGAAPTATSVSGKLDIFTFFCDGTNTYGSTFGQNF